MPQGPSPPLSVAIAVLVATSVIETSFESPLAVQSLWPSDVTAIIQGRWGFTLLLHGRPSRVALPSFASSIVRTCPICFSLSSANERFNHSVSDINFSRINLRLLDEKLK